jgi:hypothetical protein
MAIRRFPSVFALPLAVALVASTAHAEQARKQPKPAGGTPLKVDSPNMAMSIRDWHPELAAASPRTTATTTCNCPCGKNATQTATTTAAPGGKPIMQTATYSNPAGQRGNQGKRSGKPLERASEVPLSSLRP